MRLIRLILPIVIVCCACSNKENAVVAIPNLNAVRANLAFTCVYEAASLPPLNPEADSLFRYARHLHKVIGPKDFNDMARYYRIAAAHDHHKANRNLQLLLSRGQATSPNAQKETIGLAARLIEQGIPGGYFDIGFYLGFGYGLKQDREMALRYYRKAADLGNPEAQFHISEQLAPWDRAPTIAAQMRACAADQGHGRAAYIVGIYMRGDSNFPEAMRAFQKGVAAGNSLSALELEHAFNGPPPYDELNYLALSPDLERSRRYELIGAFIDRHDGRNPKVPDIDQIVPLPPAKLPPWDGTFQWEKEYEAAMASPPPKPSDELINRLCKARNLDPATGLPIPPPPRAALGTLAPTGERCPESGKWCVPEFRYLYEHATRHFRKGDTMPSLTTYNPRVFLWLDDWLGMRTKDWAVTWELIAYDEA
ncbi:SEL1-like repeat protein [Cupriavidus campinensis]